MSKTATKRAILISTVALLVCFSMLLGVTFAWFTDSATSSNNVISSGKLEIEFEYYNGTAWEAVEETTNVFDPNALWEPGYTDVVYLRLTNAGSLALKYQLGINIAAETSGTNMAGETFNLSDYIYMGVVEGVNGETEPYADRADAVADVDGCGIISTGYSKEGSMLKDAKPLYFAVVVYMPETVNNVANAQSPDSAPEITLGISLVAGQHPYESDSFGTDYDKDSEYGTPDGAVTYVANEADLILAMSRSGTVVLTDDITLTQPLFVSSAGSVLSLSTTAVASPAVERVFVAMDLRGHSIIMETESAAIMVAKSAILSVKDSVGNGGIYNRAEGGSAIENYGALEIKNGTISGALHAICNKGGDVAVSGGTVIGSAGKAPSLEDSPQPIRNESGNVTVTGGAFNSKPEAVEDGYEIVDNGDGTFSVVDIDGKPDDSVTEVPGTDTDVPGTDTEEPGIDTEQPGIDTDAPGGDVEVPDITTYVTTEEELIAAVAKGGTIILSNTIELTKDLTVSANSIIDLNGNTLGSYMSLDTFDITSTASCTITGSGTVSECNITGCTLESGKFRSDVAYVDCTINGGAFADHSTFTGCTLNASLTSNMEFMGGVFTDCTLASDKIVISDSEFVRCTINDGKYRNVTLTKCDVRGGNIQTFELDGSTVIKGTFDAGTVKNVRLAGGKYTNCTITDIKVLGGEFDSCTFTDCDIELAITCSTGKLTNCTINAGTYNTGDFTTCTVNDGSFSAIGMTGCAINGGTNTGGGTIESCTVNGGTFSGGGSVNNTVVNGGSFSGGNSFNSCTFYNGTFNGSYSSCKFYGGTFSSDVSTSLTMSYSCSKIADGVYVVSKNVTLPEGSVIVYTEEELTSAVATGGYILFGSDIVLTKNLDVSADSIINLNNYTLSPASDVYIKAAGYCVIKGGTVQKLDIYYCTIDGGTFDGYCTLYSCTISAGTYGKYSCYDCTILDGEFGKNGTVVGGLINGGTFEGGNFSNVFVKEGQFEECSFTDCELRGGYYTGGTFNSTDSDRGQITGVYGGTYSGGKFTDVSIGNYPMLVDCEIIASGIGDATYTDCTITDCTSHGGSYENCTFSGCTFYFGSFTGKTPTEDQIAEGHKLVDKGNGKYTIEIA